MIYRVYDVNFRHNPIKILDVEFYNPNIGFAPKISHKLPVKLFEETFTSKPERYELSSQCNACVLVNGIQEEQMYFEGYKKVLVALAILNRELNINGKVYPRNVFITNKTFTNIWGSTSALSRDFKAVDEVENFQEERIKFINKLRIDKVEDKKVLDLIKEISQVLTDNEYFFPEKIWIILEATFGDFLALEKLFLSIYKIFIKYNLYTNWKFTLSNAFNPQINFNHPDLHYEIDKNICEKLGINYNSSKGALKKFENNLLEIKSNLNLAIVDDIIDKVALYANDKAKYYIIVEKYLNYILNELYSQRNLYLHKKMSDEMFLLKQKQLKAIMNIFIEIFLNEYLLTKKRQSIRKVVDKINRKASLI